LLVLTPLSNPLGLTPDAVTVIDVKRQYVFATIVALTSPPGSTRGSRYQDSCLRKAFVGTTALQWLFVVADTVSISLRFGRTDGQRGFIKEIPPTQLAGLYH
jgi:hypothetical protein